MAVKKPSDSGRKTRLGWRGPVVVLLGAVGIVALVGFMFVHWTERQVLTTDNWVKLAGPLPKNEQVATALSDYSVNNLFAGVQLEDKISQALPERADFLAPVLTERLEIRAKDLTKNIIQSDRFEAVWTTANRIGHQKLMSAARSESPASAKPRTTDLSIKLSSLRDSIRERLGKSSDKIFSGSTAAPAPPDISINLDFKTKFDTFRKFVKTTDFLNGVLGLFAAACLLGALVISRRRRRLLMVFSVAVLIFALLQLIGTNAVRPAVLNHVQNEAYRPAVGVIYDNLLANFRHSALVVALASAIVFAAALLSQKRFINKSKFLADQLKQYKSTKLYREWKKFRKLVNQYKLHISGVVIILGLAVMALAFNLDWQGIIRSVLAVIIILELVFLAAARRRRGRV